MERELANYRLTVGRNGEVPYCCIIAVSVMGIMTLYQPSNKKEIKFTKGQLLYNYRGKEPVWESVERAPCIKSINGN